MISLEKLQSIVFGYVKVNTANNETFDCGATTSLALRNFVNQTPPLLCGLSDEKSNGNGSLMRILPVAVYFYNLYGDLNEETTTLYLSSLIKKKIL